MASDDEKKIVDVSSNKKEDVKNGKTAAKATKEKKPHKSWAWFFGVVILILISITFILPTTVFSAGNSSRLVFGKYNGKKIELELDSYFYYQLQNLANYCAQQYGGNLPTSAWAQVYYQAFQNAIVYEALTEMADDAGIHTSKSAISEAIIDSGYWNNENGEFDTERYQSATSSEKSEIQRQAELSIPYSYVLSDVMSAKIPQTEVDFVTAISSDARSFDYLVVGAQQYGNEETVAYANNNPEPFVQIGLSVVTFQTETEASDALAAIQAGTAFDDYVANSLDTYKSNNGSMGLVFKYQLDNALANAGDAASDTVFSAKEGDVVGPYYTGAGYSIFRVDSVPAMADTTDESVLSSIKNYISLNDNAIISTYIAGVAQDAYKVATEDVDKAIRDYNLAYYSVDDVAMNAGESGLVYSFSTADTAGYLATAALDETYLKKLYSVDYGTVLEPQLSGTSYVIAIPQEAEAESEGTTSYASYIKQMIPTLYPSYASQFTIMDMQNAVVTSDKVENNFFDVYYNKVLGGTSN